MTNAPVLLMIAGPNGSGKTTLTRQLRIDGIDLGFHINPDDIALTLNGTYTQRVSDAQAIADHQRQDCLNRHASFSFETVMSHPSKIEVLKLAHARGYINTLFFVGTETPELNVARVRQRVALGGHDVPDERIIARYERSMFLLPEAIAYCDRTVLFDNSFRDLPGTLVRLAPVCEITCSDDRRPSPFAEWRFEFAAGRLPKWVVTYVLDQDDRKRR